MFYKAAFNEFIRESIRLKMIIVKSLLQCDLCGKGFIHLKSYQIHKMIHSGERHIKCDICNLALLSKSHLKQHLRVHTGERPHECEVCGKKFAKKSNLNAHKKKVSEGIFKAIENEMDNYCNRILKKKK